MTAREINAIMKELWPTGYPELYENDRLNGYCDGLEAMAREVKKLIRKKK